MVILAAPNSGLSRERQRRLCAASRAQQQLALEYRTQTATDIDESRCHHARVRDSDFQAWRAPLEFTRKPQIAELAAAIRQHAAIRAAVLIIGGAIVRHDVDIAGLDHDPCSRGQ